MTILDCFAINKVISIHYLDSNNFSPELTPLVYVPGALNFAEQFKDEMKVLSPRRSISLSLRGRGKSDAPLTGYTLEEHASDIRAVVENSQVKNYCLMAYSMGVPYSIKFASRYPEQVKGLILCDYPAKYPSIPDTWSEKVFSKGHIDEERHHVVTGIQCESHETLLLQELERITCPVLIIKGGTEQSLLKNDEVEKYKKHLKNVNIAEFMESGHELWVPDYDVFFNTVGQFLEKLDK